MSKRKWLDVSSDGGNKSERLCKTQSRPIQLKRQKTHSSSDRYGSQSWEPKSKEQQTRTIEEKNLVKDKRNEYIDNDACSSKKEHRMYSATSDGKHGKKRKLFHEEECNVGQCQINEVYGDLFEAPPNHSLAHCVAADMRMGSGIAVNFRQTFRHLGELLDQNKYIGDVAVLNVGDRFIYNLVTKKFSQGKPKLKDVHSSLVKMRKHCEDNRVKNLSMPRIGCGLDRLEWDDVKEAIVDAFHGLEITITVHDFTPPVDYRSSYKKHSFQIADCDISLSRLAYVHYVTALLFCTCEDGNISHSGSSLLCYLNLYKDFSKHIKKAGKLVSLISYNNQNLFGLVVKKNKTDAFSYSNFENCLFKLKSILHNQKIHSVAFESFDNSFIKAKVISVIKHVFEFSKLKFYICKSQKVNVNEKWGHGGWKHRRYE